MPAETMHAGEVPIDAALVRQLLAAQFPAWADLPIRAVRSTGTVNAIYRLGDHLSARLPRVREWARDLEKEWHWLPTLAPHLSLRVPTPVAKGRPDRSYPFAWAIYEWIDGQPYADELVDDEQRAAKELARFVVELRRIGPIAGAPRGGRRPLRELDAVTRAAIAATRGVIDSDAVAAAWERALDAPAWNGT
ncbi:MAG: phosphotransferase, partial [Chloroflexia bacterium]|nr:phosphotransferase [Chloroflexia bacterium]